MIAEGRATRVRRVVVAVLVVQVVFVGLRVVVLGDIGGFATYDGRAYYRLALDPLTLAVEEHGITFTRPAYWQTRIGYPAATWVLSLGGLGRLVPAALVVVNVLATCGITALGARLAVRHGRSAWWGALPASWAGFLVGLSQDLTEPLAGLLLLAALVAIRSGRHAVAAVVLTAAALTRETTLLVAAAVVVAAVLSRRGGARRTSPPWWVGVVPLVGYAGWRAWVRERWSDVAAAPSDNILGMPGLELVRYLGTAVGDLTTEGPNLVLLVPTLLALGLAATGLRTGGPVHERVALVGYLVVLVSLPVWDRGQAYLRWGCEPLLLGWILLTTATDGTADAARAARGGRALVPFVALVWVVAASQSVAYPLVDGPWSGWWTWA